MHLSSATGVNLKGSYGFEGGFPPRTLLHLLSGSQPQFSIDNLPKLITSLGDEIHNWHVNGIVHGHITTSNISVNEEVSAFLLDAAVGASLAQVCQERSLQVVHSIAPEIVEKSQVGYAADVYGFGQVIKRALFAIKKKHQFSSEREEILSRLNDYEALAEGMTMKEPGRRPKLAEVRQYLQALHKGEGMFAGPKKAGIKPAADQDQASVQAAKKPKRRISDTGAEVKENDRDYVYRGGADVETSIYKVIAQSKAEGRGGSSESNPEVEPASSELNDSRAGALPESDSDYGSIEQDDLGIDDFLAPGADDESLDPLAEDLFSSAESEDEDFSQADIDIGFDENQQLYSEDEEFISDSDLTDSISAQAERGEGGNSDYSCFCWPLVLESVGTTFACISQIVLL